MISVFKQFIIAIDAYSVTLHFVRADKGLKTIIVADA